MIALTLQDMTASLRRQEKDRKWRSNVKRLEVEVRALRLCALIFLKSVNPKMARWG